MTSTLSFHPFIIIFIMTASSLGPQYRIGQLFMISKHCCEQSDGGDGVEVVRNEPDDHPQYGRGQLTEKRIYLNR